MDNSWIITLLGFVATLIAVVTPIIKLNVSITKLNVTIEQINKTLGERIEHEKIIDEKLQDHELRLDRLERKH